MQDKFYLHVTIVIERDKPYQDFCLVFVLNYLEFKVLLKKKELGEGCDVTVNERHGNCFNHLKGHEIFTSSFS